MSLSRQEIERYRRHLLLPEIGGQGQQRLKDSKILVVGAGGLGCPILTYLAAAGAGQIHIVDADRVALSNLQRQALYTTEDIGKPKAECAAKALAALNPEIELSFTAEYLDTENAKDLVAGCDLVIEGVDRFAPRYLINEACRTEGVPLLSAAIGRFDGQIALFPMDEASSCYRCLVPSPPEDAADCETEGVLGAVPGVVGSLAALEAMKYLTGMKGAMKNELLIFQGREGRLRRISVPKDPACPVCADEVRA
ncbi:ThiF family adenylyltransferase [Parvularcula marina]|uniref:HesA/MoeB/ThiF family protein n=1 Tax=Parvularcula marina TaxID=2292771 RepID=UPI00351919CB